MFAKRLALILLCLLPACAPAVANNSPQTNATLPASTPTIPVDAETLDFIAKYLALRDVPGQFTGDAWNEDVDRWMGPKHAAMLEVGARLGNGRLSCDQLTQLLNKPDHTVQGGDPLHELIQTVPGYEAPPNETDQFLVYEWRGTHDFLFFVCEDGRITTANWWYAGE